MVYLLKVFVIICAALTVWFTGWIFVKLARELLAMRAFRYLILGLFAFGGFLYLIGVPLSVSGYH